jgi:hypothetical protein
MFLLKLLKIVYKILFKSLLQQMGHCHLLKWERKIFPLPRGKLLTGERGHHPARKKSHCSTQKIHESKGNIFFLPWSIWWRNLFLFQQFPFYSFKERMRHNLHKSSLSVTSQPAIINVLEVRAF